MSKYRDEAPQLAAQPFLTDGGLETSLIFHQGLELPYFAAFPLVETADGSQRLREYFRNYIAIAAKYGAGSVLETPTWRASTDWGVRLGYDAGALRRANQRAVQLLEEVREESGYAPVVISGCIGPRGDGYSVSARMTAEEAQAYHSPQVQVFADTACDMVAAYTLNYVEEAIGVARAAQRANVPVALSFTIEIDGRLPSGQELGEAIRQVDEATGGCPLYFMLNCAHPVHISEALPETAAPWTGRLRGLRVNASRMSHAELDQAPTLDDGDPVELGGDCAGLARGPLTAVNIMGGCCGTDHRHVEQIAAAWLGSR